MNKILNSVMESRKGVYCHAIEVSSVWELESFLDCVHCEFIENYILDDIVEFCLSAELYCLDEEYEELVYSFDIEKYLRSL